MNGRCSFSFRNHRSVLMIPFLLLAGSDSVDHRACSTIQGAIHVPHNANLPVDRSQINPVPSVKPPELALKSLWEDGACSSVALRCREGFLFPSVCESSLGYFVEAKPKMPTYFFRTLSRGIHSVVGFYGCQLYLAAIWSHESSLHHI
jgi:hypothetical protein